MASTNIPAFIAAYVSALSSPIAALNAKAHDGQPMSDEHLAYVAVGYQESGASVEAEHRVETLARGQFEDFDVFCEAAAFDGGGSMATARAAALALFDASIAVLQSDWTVSGTVTQATSGPFTINQYQTKDGAVCVVDFAVSVRLTPL